MSGFLDDLRPHRRRQRPPADQDAERSPVVPFVPFRCPHCGAVHPRTYGQRGRTRYHRCRACLRLYRSLEIDPDDLGELPGFSAVQK
jgi:hypothetical protein